jgi:ParB-like chromosome segregation protein Spo0J
MKHKKLALAELLSLEGNARRGNVDLIAESLSVNGQYKPIVVNVGTHTGRALEVLAGNHTVQGARQLGWTMIDAVLVDVDRDAALRIALVDNRSNDLATYDDSALIALLQEVNTLEGTGFDDGEIDRLLALLDESDEFGGDADSEDVAMNWGVIISCSNESTQAQTLDALIALGYDVRAVM